MLGTISKKLFITLISNKPYASLCNHKYAVSMQTTVEFDRVVTDIEFTGIRRIIDDMDYLVIFFVDYSTLTLSLNEVESCELHLDTNMRDIYTMGASSYATYRSR